MTQLLFCARLSSSPRIFPRVSFNVNCVLLLHTFHYSKVSTTSESALKESIALERLPRPRIITLMRMMIMKVQFSQQNLCVHQQLQPGEYKFISQQQEQQHQLLKQCWADSFRNLVLLSKRAQWTGFNEVSSVEHAHSFTHSLNCVYLWKQIYFSQSSERGHHCTAAGAVPSADPPEGNNQVGSEWMKAAESSKIPFRPCCNIHPLFGYWVGVGAFAVGSL